MERKKWRERERERERERVRERERELELKFEFSEHFTMGCDGIRDAQKRYNLAVDDK